MTKWEGSVSSAPRTGETVDFLGMTFAIRLTGKDTNQTFSITDNYALPGTGAPFLHAHPAAETFIVLEGEFEVYGRADGKKVSLRVGPGYVHHVASNAQHGYKNVGTTPGRMLLVFHPADLQEAFFKDAGRPTTPTANPTPLQGPPPPEVLERLMALMRKHKIEASEPPSF